ncbi:YkgJ family cysteine cluster protein [Comamonas thiooxydans]|uniref:YkgJ family cysteine cluster protein n=1 Tax=Comamonas thiooxydans TaxID=363952 RepID=UPI0018A65A6B|nr:YkgJ family cysteine cluster protein [Comamonas thiooxydans]QOQ83777.1 YkgJ family cysteine cluster protein [Comamonas thiooxydans]
MTQQLPGVLLNSLYAMLKNGAPALDITKMVHDLADATIDQTLHAYAPREHAQITCKKSCSHCCKQSTILIEEADALYLQEKTGKVVQYEANGPTNKQGVACSFLDAQGNCSVYEWRPITCRVSLSVDNPQLCATEEERKMVQAPILYKLMFLGLDGHPEIKEKYIASRGVEADIRDFFPK